MIKFDWRTLELETRSTKPCDHFRCDQEGEFPAPKNIHDSNERYYFCLEHVKAYNTQWNYLEQLRSSPHTAQPHEASPHPFKKGKKFSSHFFTKNPQDPLNILGDDQDTDTTIPTQQFFSPKTKEGKAFVTLELSWPFTEADLKQAYKTLAKKHHPDLNQGDAEAINRFRDIKEAYELLTDLLLLTFGPEKAV